MNSTHRNHACRLESIQGPADHQCRTCLMIDELIEQLIRNQIHEARLLEYPTALRAGRGEVIPIRRKPFQESALPSVDTLQA